MEKQSSTLEAVLDGIREIYTEPVMLQQMNWTIKQAITYLKAECEEYGISDERFEEMHELVRSQLGMHRWEKNYPEVARMIAGEGVKIRKPIKPQLAALLEVMDDVRAGIWHLKITERVDEQRTILNMIKFIRERLAEARKLMGEE